MTIVSDVRPWSALPPLRLAGSPQRVVPFVVGYEPIPEGVSVAGGSWFRFLMEPVTAVAVVYEQGWVLIDGGFDPRRIRDRQTRIATFDYENYLPIVPPGDPLVDQISDAGLSLNDLAAAIVTHAHFDHTGAARLLRADQPLLLQRDEWTHASSVADPRGAFLLFDDLNREGLTIGLLDGDTELAIGIRVIDTSGHTPGHQSVVADLPDRTVVFAGDAADLRANVDHGVHCGSTVGETGEADARAAIQRLRALDAQDGVEVWPAHDPDWGPWRAVIDAR